MAAEAAPVTTLTVPETPSPPAVSTAPTAVTEVASPPPWYESLPDGLKGEKSLHQFKDVAAVSQAYLETKKMVGAKLDGMVKVPGKDAKPEDVAAYRAAIGVPKLASDYTLTVSDPTSGQTIDAARWEAAVPFFHKHAFTQDQVQALAEWSVQEQQTTKAKANETNLAALDTLADQWGEMTFNRRAQLAQRTVDRFGSPELKTWLNTSGATNHPELFKMLSQIGEQFAEDGLIDGSVTDQPAGAALDDKIEAARTKYLKTVDGSQERARALEEYEQLLKLKHPESIAR